MADVERNTEQSKWQQLAAGLGMLAEGLGTRAKQAWDSDAAQDMRESAIDVIGCHFGSHAQDATRAQRIAARLNPMLTQTITVCRTERDRLHALRNILRRGNPAFCQPSRQALVSLDVGLSYMLDELLASTTTESPSMRSVAIRDATESALVSTEGTPSPLVGLLRGQSPYERLCRTYDYVRFSAENIQRNLSDGRDTNLLEVIGAAGALAALASELHIALPYV